MVIHNYPRTATVRFMVVGKLDEVPMSASATVTYLGDDVDLRLNIFVNDTPVDRYVTLSQPSKLVETFSSIVEKTNVILSRGSTLAQIGKLAEREQMVNFFGV